MRRSTLFLALLLVVGVVVFIDLLPPRTPASASDLVGSWRLDGEAQWDKLQNSHDFPTFVAHMQSMDQKAAEHFKSQFLAAASATVVFQFTADKMIWHDKGGVRREVSYTITAIWGNVLTADLFDDKGDPLQEKFAITADRLEMSAADSLDAFAVLRRVR